MMCSFTKDGLDKIRRKARKICKAKKVFGIKCIDCGHKKCYRLHLDKGKITWENGQTDDMDQITIMEFSGLAPDELYCMLPDYLENISREERTRLFVPGNLSKKLSVLFGRFVVDLLDVLEDYFNGESNL